ncbi:glycosyltransferase [Candidatus Woesearchaeota archaeon]|nr:glycosyltransferase [Candidatus Woesearchaeota archaeon]
MTVITGSFPGARNKVINGVRYVRAGRARSYFLSRMLFTLVAGRIASHLEKDLVVDDFSPFSPSFSFVNAEKPVLCVLRNFFREEVKKKHPFIGPAIQQIELFCLRKYDNFLVFSPSMEKVLKRFLDTKKVKKKIFRLFRGIELSSYLSSYTEVKQRPAFRKTKQGKGDYVLFLGRVEMYQKGIDILLEGYLLFRKNLQKQGKPAPKLLIAGNASSQEQEKIQTLVKERGLESDVCLVGRVEGQKKVRLLQESLFVVMPSRYESWGAVAIEAAAAGKAVIGSDIDGLRDAIVNNSTGLLFELGKAIPASAQHLSAKMLQLYNNPALRKELEQKAIKRSTDFDWSKVLKQQEALYARVSRTSLRP